MDWDKEKMKKWIVFFFFGVLFSLGFYFFADYGLSYDEPTERGSGIRSAFTAIKFFTGNSFGYDLEKWSDCYYGMGLQHILLLGDYLAGVFTPLADENPQSWLLRHLLTFLFTWVGLIFLYMTGRLLWRDRLKALVPVVIFLFMPRFLAESFYNVKDMGLLAGMMTGGYFMVRYALFTTWKNALLLGIASAFVCSIRLAGLQLFLAGVGIAIFMDLFCKGKWQMRKILLQLFTLFVSFYICMILFHPASWTRGYHDFFFKAVAFMLHHPWNGTVRFCGADYIAGKTTPWYYLAVWIGVTTPLPVLFVLFFGSGGILKKLFRAPRLCFRKRTMLVMLLFFCMFWVELLFITRFVKSYYNGWRQFYFLAYPLFFLAACGVFYLWHWVKSRKQLRLGFLGIIAVITGLHIAWVAAHHPYQYLYFNILPSDPQNQFELDYWYVSYKDAMNRIMENESGKSRHILLAYNIPPSISFGMVGNEDTKKFLLVSPRGHFDYVIIINNRLASQAECDKIYPLTNGNGYGNRKVIFDEIRYVHNSIWTKKVTAYRIVGCERTPDVMVEDVGAYLRDL